MEGIKKVLQIGLGSMGSRRIRNMQRLGIEEIVGFDPSSARREAAEKKYGIKTTDSGSIKGFGAIIISTPPNHHNEYMKEALKFGIPAFVEASVIKEGLSELGKDEIFLGGKQLIYPSSTLLFHPCIETINNIVKSGKYGKVTSFNYYMGQYLPDWHPWESVKDYYAGVRETAASREMVPFELTWLVEVIGWPTSAVGIFGKTLDMGVDIDDTYAIALGGDGWIGSLTVDVVARYASRNLTLNMENAQIQWSWDENTVWVYAPETGAWEEIYPEINEEISCEGYNRNIPEGMYVRELECFFEAVKGNTRFPNNLNKDLAVLNILDSVEHPNK